MKFSADLHIHTDYDQLRDRWHGERPEEIAKAIIQARLDVFSITEHNKITNHSFDVKDEVERIAEKKGIIKPMDILGAELTTTYGHQVYHLIYLFEERFNQLNLPAIPPRRFSIHELERYQIDYPGVSILAHPSWHAHKPCQRKEVTYDLIKSGLVDGVEILNGSILHNGSKTNHTKETIAHFLRATSSEKLAAIGTSDAHKAMMVGIVKNNF